MIRLLKPSNPSKSIISKHPRRSECERKGWFEKEEETIVVGKGKEKEWSQNSQPMHDGKSPGPLAIHFVLCNRMWVCVVSAICDKWERGTHADDKAMQPTTSATNHLQP